MPFGGISHAKIEVSRWLEGEESFAYAQKYLFNILPVLRSHSC